MLRPDIYIEEYKKEYGTRKYEKIKTHITNSRHSKRLIKESIQKGFIPTGQDFIETVMSNMRYSVASVETIMAASITLMIIWLGSIDQEKMQVGRYELEQISQRIAQLCREMRF